MGELGFGDLKENLVEGDFAGIGVYAETGELFAVGGGGGEPDLFVGDGGRRPCPAMNGDFPGDVLGFTPLGGELSGRGAVLGGASEVGPVSLGEQLCGKKRRDKEGAEK